MRTERRHSTRVDVLVPVEFRHEPPSQARHFTGLMKNFSCRGMLMVTDEFMPRDSQMKVEVKLPSSLRAIAVKARVVRVGEYSSGYRYEVAGEFQNMDPDDCFYFQDYIAERVTSAKSH